MDPEPPDGDNLLGGLLPGPLFWFPWYVWAAIVLVVGALVLIYLSAG